MATSSDHQLVGWAMFSFGPCFLFNTQRHCYYCHVLDSSCEVSSAFLRLLSFGSDISCQILCNVATDCTLSRNLRRSVPLTYPAASANVHNSRVACSETSVILCKRRTALDEMLLLLKMQNKMIVNLSMESSLLYNEIWSINPLNHIFQVSRKPSCHTAASKSLNKSCAPTHPRPPSSTFPLHAQVTAPYPGFADWADQNSTATELDSKFPAAAHVHNASTWRVTCFCASFSFNSSCSTRSLLARPACRSSWPSDFASLSESMAMYALVCSCQLLSICCSFSYLQPQTESGRCVQYAQMVWRCLNSNGITLQSIAHLEWFHLQSCSEVMSFQSWHDGLFFIAKILFSCLWHTNSTLLSDSEILKLKQLQLHCMFVMLYASYFRTHKRHKKLPSGSCL